MRPYSYRISLTFSKALSSPDHITDEPWDCYPAGCPPDVPYVGITFPRLTRMISLQSFTRKEMSYQRVMAHALRCLTKPGFAARVHTRLKSSTMICFSGTPSALNCLMRASTMGEGPQRKIFLSGILPRTRPATFWAEKRAWNELR